MKTHLTFTILLLITWPAWVSALESDRDQPAVIDAESVDIDFGTGKRTYEGDVRLVQGTLRITADILEVHFKNDQLEKAIAKGKRAVFRQRPDGKEHDVVGKANFILLDEINNTITLTKDAELSQGPDVVSAKTIEYNMATDKMKMRGGTQTTKNPEPAPSASQPSSATTPSSSSTTEEADSTERRARITLKPKGS
ncbi:MAG: lipopolysaccharide export system protein LptA [Parasphingorhabdus sp.]|jgi:lipopolysaccharide export system protein LptA